METEILLPQVGESVTEGTISKWLVDIGTKETLLLAGQVLAPGTSINNAAIRRQQAIETMSLADWRAVTAVILDAAFLCARASLPHMVAAGGGAIVNIGGISAHFGAVDRPHVVAAKAGVIGLTKAIAVDYAARNVRANCVVPGTMDTTRGENAHPVAPHPGGHQALIDRLGTPEELAAAVRYLCSPDAAYVTGQTLHVNGGRYLP